MLDLAGRHVKAGVDKCEASRWGSQREDIYEQDTHPFYTGGNVVKRNDFIEGKRDCVHEFSSVAAPSLAMSGRMHN